MIKPIGYSIGTQCLNSAGNFIIALLIVRLISLESFGQYVYIFAISGVASTVTTSITGAVYSIFRPRFRLFADVYQQNYNAFTSLIVAIAVCAASVTAWLIAPQHEVLASYVIPTFVASYISLENLRFQASANGLHATMFFVDLARLTGFGLAVAMLSIRGAVDLSSIMATQGIVGIAACVALYLACGTKVAFRRLAWVAMRHTDYGRYLLPATLVSFFHSAGLQLIAGHHFGPQATGLLRLSELPFSAVNPIKQSLAYFLPRFIHDFEQRPAATQRPIVIKLAIACVVGSTILMAAAWITAIFLIPILTGKEYPIWVGLFFCVAYIFAYLMTPLHIYLNMTNQAGRVLRQATLGAIVALIVYFATYDQLGYIASAVASCACFFSIVVAGTFAILKHHPATVRDAANDESSHRGSPVS